MRQAVIECFEQLKAAGYAPPWRDEHEGSVALNVWLLVLGNGQRIEPSELPNAVKVYAYTASNNEWPEPDVLRRLALAARSTHAPDHEPPPPQHGTDYIRRLDHATSEVNAMEPRPCGASGRHSCPPTCEPCLNAIFCMANELATTQDQASP